jgi:hypothetical protein
MLNAHLIDLFLKRIGLRALGAPIIALLNGAGETIDSAVPLLRRSVPGTLHANYHVEAVA